jgi:hypothetical protein
MEVRNYGEAYRVHNHQAEQRSPSDPSLLKKTDYKSFHLIMKQIGMKSKIPLNNREPEPGVFCSLLRLQLQGANNTPLRLLVKFGKIFFFPQTSKVKLQKI